MAQTMTDGASADEARKLYGLQGMFEYPHIERRDVREVGDFRQAFDLANRPVILTGVDFWRGGAPMSLAWLREHYGTLRLDALKHGTGAPIQIRAEHLQRWSTLADYLDALASTPPQWETNLDTGYEDRAGIPYLSNMDLPHNFPRIHEQFTRPAFLGRNYLAYAPGEAYRQFAHGEVYVGPANSGFAHLHFDMWRTSVVAAQLFGRKRWLVYPPTETKYLYLTGGVAHMSAIGRDPNLEKFPDLAKAKGFIAEMEPGELLWLPPSWWHTTVHLSPSIAINYRHLSRHMLGSSIFDQAADSVISALLRQYRGYVLRRSG